MSESASAFKQLYSGMINTGGNLNQVLSGFKDAAGKVKKIKCFVKESFPHFLVTDNHCYVPAYFTKKAVDSFKSSHTGVNIVDLKSKIIEIGDWSLEMVKVDSSSVFTSYAGIEIRLIVNSFKVQTGKHLLTKYPVNLYRDDEIKTLFQAYHHRTLASRVTKGDSLPDVSRKGDSVVSLAAGNKFQYGFKSGTTATIDMTSIFRTEKGANALKALQGNTSSNAGVRAVSSVKKSKTKASAPGIKGQSQAISKKTPNRNLKQTPGRAGKKTAGQLRTPGDIVSSANTPGVNQKSFKSMKKYLQSKGRK